MGKKSFDFSRQSKRMKASPASPDTHLKGPVYFFLSFRMRRTLWLMRSSLSVPLFTAAITASKASVK